MATGAAARVCRQGAFDGLFALAYFGAGILGNIFYFEPENVATFWPASGILLAVLLLSRFRTWAILVLAAAVTQVAWDVLVYSRAVGISLIFTAANVLEACTGAFLLRRGLGMSGTFSQLKEVQGLAAVAGLCTTALGALAGQPPWSWSTRMRRTGLFGKCGGLLMLWGSWWSPPRSSPGLV